MMMLWMMLVWFEKAGAVLGPHGLDNFSGNSFFGGLVGGVKLWFVCKTEGTKYFVGWMGIDFGAPSTQDVSGLRFPDSVVVISDTDMDGGVVVGVRENIIFCRLSLSRCAWYCGGDRWQRLVWQSSKGRVYCYPSVVRSLCCRRGIGCGTQSVGRPQRRFLWLELQRGKVQIRSGMIVIVIVVVVDIQSMILVFGGDMAQHLLDGGFRLGVQQEGIIQSVLLCGAVKGVLVVRIQIIHRRHERRKIDGRANEDTTRHVVGGMVP